MVTSPAHAGTHHGHATLAGSGPRHSRLGYSNVLGTSPYMRPKGNGVCATTAPCRNAEPLGAKPRAQRRLLHREGSRPTGHPLAPPRDQGGTPHGHRVSGPPIQRSLSAYRTAPMLFAQPARTASNNRQLPSWRRTGLGSIPIGSVSITPPPRMCHTLPQQHHLPDTRQKAQVRLAAPSAGRGGFGTFGWATWAADLTRNHHSRPPPRAATSHVSNLKSTPAAFSARRLTRKPTGHPRRLEHPTI